MNEMRKLMETIQKIDEVAVHRDDPEMDEYNLDQDEEQQDLKDAPYYVSWSAQSWEWYGDGDPEEGQGRYKPKGDGGDIVAVNVPTYAEAQKIANRLDAAYEDGRFVEDEAVYNTIGEDHYVLDYRGADVHSMHDMDEFDRERMRMRLGESYGEYDLPQQPQRQDSLEDQLRDLVEIANRLGMYDAADFLKSRIR